MAANGSLLYLRRCFSTLKPRVVILGSGWGGFHAAKNIDKSKYDVRVISPANHFLFTPLLPSTAVGTLEFRCIQEPVRTISGLREYYQAKARDIDFDTRTIECRDIFKETNFKVQYDYLVIACGAKTNTFGTPGVDEREGKEIMFLKHLYHSRQIRNRILECFERASVPDISSKERDRLLSFVIVGGGPTSCEFTGELHDFINEDVAKWFPDLRKHIKVTLVEAGGSLLGAFNKILAQYVQKSLGKRNIDVRLNTAITSVETTVEEKDGKELKVPYTVAKLGDGSDLPFGMMVWSAGLKQVKFIEALGLEHGPTGRLLIDEYLQIPGHEGRVFAIGDCAVTENAPLAPLAKVAQQQANYIANTLNSTSYVDATKSIPRAAKPFTFFDPGSMAQIGSWNGVLDFTHVGVHKHPFFKGTAPTVTGLAAFITWRSAYWGRQVSLSNKILIPMHWFKSWIFGRDICRF